MKSTKKLVNEPADAVTEFLEGYVSSMRHVQLLEGSPDVSQSPTIPTVEKAHEKRWCWECKLVVHTADQHSSQRCSHQSAQGCHHLR